MHRKRALAIKTTAFAPWWLLWAVPGGFTTWLMFLHRPSNSEGAVPHLGRGISCWAHHLDGSCGASTTDRCDQGCDRCTDPRCLGRRICPGVAIRRRVNQSSRAVLSRSLSPISWSGTEAAWQMAASPVLFSSSNDRCPRGEETAGRLRAQAGIPMALVFFVLLGLNHHRSGLIGFGIASSSWESLWASRSRYSCGQQPVDKRSYSQAHEWNRLCGYCHVP